MMLVFVYPFMFPFFGMPYWLAMAAGRGKSRLASFFLHLYFLGSVLLLFIHGSVRGWTNFFCLGFMVQGIILLAALLFYWTPESRQWLRGNDYNGARRA